MSDPDAEGFDRAEQAYRTALAGLPLTGEVDPTLARRTAQRRRSGRVVVGAAVVAVLLAGLVAVPRLLDRPDLVAGPAPAPSTGTPTDRPDDQAPSGWRTEYYRSIRFTVPSTWGYAFEPGTAWCAGSPDGEPRPEHRRPYVSLGGTSVVPLIGCPDQPESLLTEHVATRPRLDGDNPTDQTVRRGDWLVLQRVFPDAVLVVTTQDQSLADRVADSSGPAGPDAPCAPVSPVTGPPGARPVPGFALDGVTDVTSVSVCQYDVDGPSDGSARLRAHRPVTGVAAGRLVTALAAAPARRPDCADGGTEIALVVRIWSAAGQHDAYVRAGGCGQTEKVMDGGIDDGRTVRLLTREACSALLQPPVTLEVASGAVAKNCLR